MCSAKSDHTYSFRSNALHFLSKYQSTLQTTNLNKAGHSLPCYGFVKNANRCSVFWLNLTIIPWEMLNLPWDGFRSIAATCFQVLDNNKLILLVHRIPERFPRESSIMWLWISNCVPGWLLFVSPLPTQNQQEQLAWSGGDHSEKIKGGGVSLRKGEFGLQMDFPLGSTGENEGASMSGKRFSSTLLVVLHAANRS